MRVMGVTSFLMVLDQGPILLFFMGKGKRKGVRDIVSTISVLFYRSWTLWRRDCEMFSRKIHRMRRLVGQLAFKSF